MSNDIQAELGADFNPADYENQDNDFTPLTPGWYPAEFEKAEICQTKDETGSYLKIQLVVLGEKYNGRKVFSNINHNLSFRDIFSYSLFSIFSFSSFFRSSCFRIFIELIKLY
jgi:hypothetical protein